MDKQAKIYVAGHRGLVGSAIVRKLLNNGFNNIIVRIKEEVDLRNQISVEKFFEEEKPEYVFLAAAKVGGILANNTFPADFIYDNLLMQSNVIGMAHKYNAKKLLFLGSSCIYPKFASQPMAEADLLTGVLEPTNEPYAVAKIAGIKLCSAFNRQYGTNFIAAMPTNLYGPFDNFDLTSSHVLPALIRKFHEAKMSNQKRVVLWGTGKPMREFLHVDDLADAVVFLMEKHSASKVGEFLNVGTGKEISIYNLAMEIKRIIGVNCEVEFDIAKPDGTPRKLLNVSRMKDLGWEAKISLEEGIQDTYRWFKQNQDYFNKI